MPKKSLITSEIRNKGIICLILVGGRGKRLGRILPKPLVPICGRPMVSYIIDAARRVPVSRIIVIAGYKASEVALELKKEPVEFITNNRFLGTADAVLRAETMLKEYDGDVLILCGDMPLLRTPTLRHLIEFHHHGGFAFTMITFSSVVNSEHVVAVVSRNKNGGFYRVIRGRTYSGEHQPVKYEINGGAYCFAWQPFVSLSQKFPFDHSTGEYHLSDVPNVFVTNNLPVGIFMIEDSIECLNVNTEQDLIRARRAMRLYLHR